MFKMIATFAGLEYAGVPLNADFTLNRAAWLNDSRHQTRIDFPLASPNNPTGNVFPTTNRRHHQGRSKPARWW